MTIDGLRPVPPKVQAPTYRRPTANEITKRVECVMSWLAIGLYCLFGVGGAFVIARFVHDGGWLEIIYSVWWIPAGLATFILKGWLEQYLLGWVIEDDTDSRS